MARASLQEHQAVLYELLREFDRICSKHDISYTLFAGTALGAVRHNGLIPWDDDLDIVMMRSEYDKFLSVAQNDLDSDKYFLQKEFSEHWPMFFTKLRKNNTACLERFIPKDPRHHQGIYIDIFPCDNLSNNAAVQKMQFLASKIVIAKSLDRRGYATDSKKKKLFMLLCRLLPAKPLQKFVKGEKYADSSRVHTFFGASSRFSKSVYPRRWMTEAQKIQFGQAEYPISAHCHDLLTTLYGDYMTPPDEAARECKVHAILVDTERDYSEYEHYRDGMEFDVYTRSIR